MVKGNTNGLDVTLKCISMMLRKAIVVLAEDYLWFTHKHEIKDMEIVMILRQDGKFHGLRRKDGKILECNLPYLKDWMESQSNKLDDEPSAENTDQTENRKHDVDNWSENTDQTENRKIDVENDSDNTDMTQCNVQTDFGNEIHGQGVLHKSDVLETVSHLNVKDITSGDSEVLVPSSNAEIVGRSNIPCNVSDTTFDKSVKTVESLQMSLDEQTSAQCTSDSTELKDRVVQSGSVNGINEKENCESDQNRNDSKEMSQVTGEMMLPINPDVTENQSTMEVSTHSMGTDKSSYKECDCDCSI